MSGEVVEGDGDGDNVDDACCGDIALLPSPFVCINSTWEAGKMPRLPLLSPNHQPL